MIYFCKLVSKITHLPSNQYDLSVSLSCWANYTFRVIAYNRFGASDPSPVSVSMCSTSPCQPKINPMGVRASTTQSNPLVIEWDVRIRLFSLFVLLKESLFEIIECTGHQMGCTKILV